ncbi:hydroxymethylglutaryl-CoA reductase [Candidatus Roizmanbacteria bacterium]|jgi:hydroxymethylglutaryl-CoA reductase (NADPH)|nr:hydroxymethylglutaryl-CoA reductase [Candidatus Roizmanbacteria bacterium]
MDLKRLKTASQRRSAVGKMTGVGIEELALPLVDDERKIHCENLIGAVSLPLGIAGPITIKSQQHFVPLATTEGALVASVNRGCKAVNESGGIKVFMRNSGASRGPVFETDGLEQSFFLEDWLDSNYDLIKKTAETTSAHLKLSKFEIKIVGQYVYIRFSFNTDEAMGMNMVTIATQKIVDLIEEKTGVKCLSLAGNYDVDKKPSWLNFISGRGRQMWAEIIISQSVTEKILKTSTDRLFSVWLGKNLMGSGISGSLGFNGHFANIVAAFFAATGQDLAHTVEGSLGVTTARLNRDGSLYFSVYLPDIMMGTVGGGTNLKTQKLVQKITGVDNADDLARVMTGAVLAGELSLLASLAEGSLAKAHKKLGR